MINLIYIGHVSSSESKIAAIGFGNILITMLVLVILLGLNSFNTIKIAHAFTHNDIPLCRDYLNKGRITGII